MNGCDRCPGDDNLAYSCNYCSGSFCSNHRLPENHNCPGLRNATTQGPDFRDTDSTGGFLSGVFSWGSDEPEDAIAREHHAGMKTYDGDLEPGEPDASASESIPTSYDPDPSRDVSPDGSIAQPTPDPDDAEEGGPGHYLTEGALVAVGLMILTVRFPVRLLSQLPAYLRGLNRWLGQFLASLYGLVRTLAPVAIVLVGVLFVAGLVGTGIPAIDGPSSEAADRLSSFTNTTTDDGTNESLVQHEFAKKLNEERTSRGLDPVGTRQILRAIGEDHAENMRKHDYIGHTQPNGTTISDRYRDRGLLPQCRLPTGNGRYYNGAENVAGAHVTETVTHPGTSEYFNIDTEEELAAYLLDSWMSSDGHRKVLLLESANEIGLGIAIAEDGEVYAALEFC